MARTYSFEEVSGEIPGQDVKAPAPTAPEEGAFGRVMRKAGEAATAVGPIGVAASGALRLAGRAPQAVQAMAGPVERGARGLAQMLTPTTGRGLAAATGSAGLAGGAGEVARQAAEARGAGPGGQQLAEFAGALTPSAARAATARAAAPVVEAAGKKLYEIPEAIRTPEKQQALRTAQEAGMRVLPGQIKESRPLQMIERLMQLLPGAKEEFVKFGRQNQEAANKTIAKAFGSVDPSLRPQAMQQAKSDLQGDYNTLLSGKEFKVPLDVATRLANAFSQNEELKQFALANSRVGKFAESLIAGQKIDAPLWKEVRGDMAEYVYGMKGAAKTVGRNVLSAFDDIAAKGLGASDYQALRGIDRKWAALKSFEDAFTRDPSIRTGGDVDINKFARQYANVEPMNVLYGKEAGRGGEYVPLSLMGEEAQIFTKPRIPRTEATTLGGLLRAGTGMSLIGGGLAGGVPYVPAAGALMMAAPTVSRGAAKAYLEPEKTAAALREAGISPFATYPMLTPSKERK